MTQTELTRIRPILFSAPMVRALLEGRKTQTRRIVNFGKKAISPNGPYIESDGIDGSLRDVVHRCQKMSTVAACPYGGPGDRLWVRETLRPAMRGITVYAEDGCPAGFGNIHAKPNGEGSGESVTWPWPKAKTVTQGCPRWASRITLEIIEVRVQRLQEISEEDATAEGVLVGGIAEPVATSGYYGPRNAYKHLWETINGKGSWDANSWVWAISFKVVKP